MLFECGSGASWRCLVILTLCLRFLFERLSSVRLVLAKQKSVRHGHTASAAEFALNLRASLPPARVTIASTTCDKSTACPRCRCIFPRTVGLRLYHFRGDHVAIAGAITPSDAMKNTAVEDGKQIPNFSHALRVETCAGNRRNVRWVRVRSGCALGRDEGSGGSCFLSWDTSCWSTLRSANSGTAIC